MKYSVELYRDHSGALGELSVVFRTQSAELLEAMEGYFRALKSIEDELVAPHFGGAIDYALYGGRFTRSICLPGKANYSTDDIAAAISAYIRLFDGMMKAWLGGADRGALRRSYVQWIAAGNTLL